jgi:hypothetical protein
MKTVIEMARKAGWEMDDSLVLEPEVIWYISQETLERFAELVRADEREQCAKACEDYTDKSDADHESHGYSCAAAIRARGNT